MWTDWLPWRFILSRVARSLGFPDPVLLLTRLDRLGQPSEVAAPVELLRAGARFHARGLVNARVIQYNLDWLWPYWVERQYDPRAEAFIPRAFAVTHVNLTHRNWTAVGLPGVDRHALVDPRGLVTPRYDGWSVDAWLVPEAGEPLLPSRAEELEQELLTRDGGGNDAGLAVETRTRGAAGRLVQRVDAVWDDGPWVRIRLRADGGRPGWIALGLRPANPEGVSFIHRVERTRPAVLRVDDEIDVRLGRTPDRVRMSEYGRGDVLHTLDPREGEAAERDAVECPAGLATAAALFRLDGEGRTEVSVRIPLGMDAASEPGTPAARPAAVGARSTVDRRAGVSAPGDPDAAADRAWRTALEGTARLQAPERTFRFLYEAAVRTLVLHSPGDLYAGPYTYRRFWFRDAAFMVDALCSVGLAGRAREALSRYPERQERSGYFRSQEGEWDSNGAALWAVDRYRRLTGERLSGRWIQAIRKGARWVEEKRLDPGLEAPHAGLLPAGFSAEHLGPNDYFYWDDFWCAAGLRAAARMLREDAEDPTAAARWDRESENLLAAVDRSIRESPGHRRTGAVPASPYRRMDAGAVGSLCAGYPLRLWNPRDPRLLATVGHLQEHHMVNGGFFQDMIHSGINPYLTLHMAQVLLRAGDSRQELLVRSVAALASSTGQWPEAVHPRTGGGCMGDGQHVWAAAEWLLVLRNWFVREEGDRLILASGVPGAWVADGQTASFGPAPTPWGVVTIRLRGTDDGAVVEWSADWRDDPPTLEVRLPGHRFATPDAGDDAVRVARIPPPSSKPTTRR